MADPLSALLDLLDLEKIEEGIFRGSQPRTTVQRVFGGQVAAQALVAAGRTVPADRAVHSLHAYFLRPGDPSIPILYLVEPVRDGRSFTTRRVAGQQHGRPIFVLSASFQLEQPGLDHQHRMPDAPDPESLPSLSDLMSRQPAAWSAIWGEFEVDVRLAGEVIGSGVTDDPHRPPYSQLWFRFPEHLPDDPLLHVCLLAYVSDLTLLSAALVPHDLSPIRDRLSMASLDHAMWFHRPARLDNWILYDQTSPSASGSRALGAGQFFSQDGTLTASAVQEGLIRLPRG